MSYPWAWFGKYFGSLLSVFNTGVLEIFERSEYGTFGWWWPFNVIGEFEFDEWLFPLSNDDDDVITRGGIECPVDLPFVNDDDDDVKGFFEFKSVTTCRCLSACNKSRNCTSSFMVGNNRATIDSLSLSNIGPSISLSKQK